MEQGFFSRPLGLWLVTVAMAAALLGLGYELARHGLEPQLRQAQEQLAAEGSRANRLAAENLRLESRLIQAEAALSQRPGPPPPWPEAPPGMRPGPPPPRPEAAPPGEPETGGSRLLHRGEAVVLLEGRLVLALEGFAKDRRQARLTVRVLDGQETRADLAPGAETRIHVQDRGYRLVLRKILANSIVYTLLPLEEGPRPRRER